MFKLFQFWKWVLLTHISKNESIDNNPETNVIIATYHIKRLKNINPLVRSVLKCSYIQSVIVTNNNPDIHIEDWVTVKDNRLDLINQPERRWPGYRWNIASKSRAKYYIIIDDDFLILPDQLKILLQHLIHEPDIAHGITGHLNGKYYQNREMEVAVLNQIYAVTNKHVDRYFEITDVIKQNYPEVFPLIEKCADDIIISKAGSNKPKIHDIGQLTRCHTARTPGIAIHRGDDFLHGRQKVINALYSILQK